MRRHNDHRDVLDEVFDALLERALVEYGEKQRAFADEVANFPTWQIDDASATLTMQDEFGKGRHFEITPVGTYLPEVENFAWAWANDVFPDASRIKASEIKRLAMSTGYRVFETPHFPANAMDVDELCALALQALNGKAIFKAKNSEPWAYYLVM